MAGGWQGVVGLGRPVRRARRAVSERSGGKMRAAGHGRPSGGGPAREIVRLLARPRDLVRALAPTAFACGVGVASVQRRHACTLATSENGSGCLGSSI